jgi:hypothetical protein
VDGVGNVLVAGNTEGSLGAISRGDVDAFVAKFDRDGRRLWINQLGTAGLDLARGIAVDRKGHVVVTGYTEGALAGRHRGDYDAWLVKYDGGGTQLWKVQLGTSMLDEALGIAVDASGNVVIVGASNAWGAWLAKYSADGILLWLRTHQFGVNSLADHVTTDGSDNVFISGITSPLSQWDIWFAKYDSDGNLVWKRRIRDPDDDFSAGLALDGGGNLFIASANWLAKFKAE